VRLAALKAVIEIDRGQYDQAGQTLAYTLKFILTLQPSNRLAVRMVQLDCLNSLYPALEVLCDAHCPIKNRELSELIQQVYRQGNGEFLNVLYGERALNWDSFQNFIRQNDSKFGIASVMTFLPPSMVFEFYLPGRPLLYYDQLNFLDYWHKNIETLKAGKDPRGYLPAVFAPISDLMIPNVTRNWEAQKMIIFKYREIDAALISGSVSPSKNRQRSFEEKGKAMIKFVYPLLKSSPVSK